MDKELGNVLASFESENDFNQYPFGIIECTCDKYPRTLSINDSMLEIAGATEDPEWIEFVSNNIFFMVAYEDRPYIADCIRRADESGKPVQMRHCIVASGGEKCSRCRMDV